MAARDLLNLPQALAKLQKTNFRLSQPLLEDALRRGREGRAGGSA